MRPPSRTRPHGLRFNITPLIDVVFLLIIFFLAASHFARTEDVVPEEIDPTRLADAEEDDEAGNPKRMTATVTVDGRFYVRGEVVPRERVEALVQQGAIDFGDEFEVRLRTDRRTPYGVVEPLLLVCARANVANLKFTVREPNG